jgi:hypothetical protein
MGCKMKIYRDETGKCINIGEWDDKDGLNPLPSDAVESDEEVIVGWDGGLYAHNDPRAIK